MGSNSSGWFGGLSHGLAVGQDFGPARLEPGLLSVATAARLRPRSRAGLFSPRAIRKIGIEQTGYPLRSRLGRGQLVRLPASNELAVWRGRCLHSLLK